MAFFMEKISWRFAIHGIYSPIISFPLSKLGACKSLDPTYWEHKRKQFSNRFQVGIGNVSAVKGLRILSKSAAPFSTGFKGTSTASAAN